MAAHPPNTPWGQRTTEVALILALVVILLLALLLAKLVYEPDTVVPTDPVLPTDPVTCSNTFLGPADFQGGWNPQDVTSYFLGASSRFAGTIMLANIDSTLVESVLPVNWTLAPPKDATEECHPILILFGEHSDLKVFLNFQGSPAGGDDAAYQEMMLLIPMTQRDFGGSAWHTSVIRMYLDDETAKDIGNDFYAYNKDLATLTDTGTVFRVYPNIPAAFESTFSVVGVMQNFNAAVIPNLDALQDILAMPLVGVVEYPGAIGGEYDVCSYFDMVYDHGSGTHAKVRPTNTQHDYFVPFVPPMTSWIGLPPINNSMNGAIEVENLGWKLMFPAMSHCKYKVAP